MQRQRSLKNLHLEYGQNSKKNKLVNGIFEKASEAATLAY